MNGSHFLSLNCLFQYDLTMMTIEESFLGFLVALAAGALIGLERQQDLGAERKIGIGGVRT
ncbi:MAG: hypothetical protein KC592_11195, partial [Nitrospira sp.]|nr:hypothetical protein [Nitrospira sp.]